MLIAREKESLISEMRFSAPRLGAILLAVILVADVVGGCKHRCPCRCTASTTDCSYMELQALPDSVPYGTTKLILTGNRLTGTGADVSSVLDSSASYNLTIETLILDDNRFNTIPNTAFMPLRTTLNQINLDNNNLTVLSPEAFVPLRDTLYDLSLRHNALTSVAFVAALSQIRHLDVRENCVTDPGPIFNATTLRTLKLGGQRAECVMRIENYTLQSLGNLEQLDLRGTPNSYSLNLAPGIFAALPGKMTRFRVQDANFATIDFTGNKRLTSVYLQNIREIVDLRGTHQLCKFAKSIFLINAQINPKGTKYVSYACAVEEMYIENATDVFKDMRENLVNLQKLTIKSCNLSFETGEESPIDGMQALRELDVSNNQISSIPNRTFTPFENLTKLDISSNSLSDISVALHGASSIVTVDVSRNLLANLSDKNGLVMSSLRFLNLSWNHIEYISAAYFAECPQLRVLDFTHNRLSDISIFASIQVVQVVVLSDFNSWRCDNTTVESYYNSIVNGAVDFVCLYQLEENGSSFEYGDKKNVTFELLEAEFSLDDKPCIICQLPDDVRGLNFEQVLPRSGVPDENPDTGSTDIPIYVYASGAAGALLLIIIICVVFCCVKRRKRSPSKKNDSSAIQSNNQEANEPYVNVHSGPSVPPRPSRSVFARMKRSIFRKTQLGDRGPPDGVYEVPISTGHNGGERVQDEAIYEDGYLVLSYGQHRSDRRDGSAVTSPGNNDITRSTPMTSSLYLIPMRSSAPRDRLRTQLPQGGEKGDNTGPPRDANGSSETKQNEPEYANLPR